MNKLIVIGASGFGREVVWLIERINQVAPQWELVGFLDDSPQKVEAEINGYPVLGPVSAATNYLDAYFICAIGSAAIRKNVVEQLKRFHDIKFATIIDPNVVVSQHVSVGEGTIICAGSIITVDITIGCHVIINLSCTIGHDSQILDYCTLYPCVNISGNVRLNGCIELGTGAQIIQGKSICQDVIIGAGAVVVNNIKKPGTYVGIPAKIK
ncbi:MAG: sugar O-acyltransferase, sialic acid O-acetyltransferase NeuD family [Neobacillus sp.]|jgi:sugar O-acyltransferase (sialic acid O-acetyltransferase NeuD family)|nr:sugar O-acyltransferase, sialic acid O-acetyltransferase NeuD family [Neobacillus sp.]